MKKAHMEEHLSYIAKHKAHLTSLSKIQRQLLLRTKLFQLDSKGQNRKGAAKRGITQSADFGPKRIEKDEFGLVVPVFFARPDEDLLEEILKKLLLQLASKVDVLSKF